MQLTKTAFGMWSAGGFMHFGEPLPDERFLDLIHLAYEKGIRTFFSADVYGTGEADSLLQRSDLGAPACNDCHGNHGPAPPGLASVSRSCSLCHSANARLFDGSKHKQAFDEHGWAECSKCHGNHAIAKTNDAMLATKPGSLCGDCHRLYAKNEPAWIKTADYVHQTIAQLDEERSKLTNVSENLAAKGLDIEPISNQLNALTDSLKLSRAHIHSFSRNNFQQVAAPGGEAAKKASKLVTKARDEYRFRQAGLAASIAGIGLLMVTLYRKLRQLEKR